MDAPFIVATIGMALGTIGLITAAVGDKMKNDSVEHAGHLTLLFGGIVLLYGLSMK